MNNRLSDGFMLVRHAATDIRTSKHRGAVVAVGGPGRGDEGFTAFLCVERMLETRNYE